MKNGHNWKDKYGFGLLEIGESRFVPGNVKNIQTAASNWGRRYGVWLSITMPDPRPQFPIGAWVKRIANPPVRKKRTVHDKDNRRLIKEIHDGLRAVTVIVCQLKTAVLEIQQQLEK